MRSPCHPRGYQGFHRAASFRQCFTPPEHDLPDCRGLQRMAYRLALRRSESFAPPVIRPDPRFPAGYR